MNDERYDERREKIGFEKIQIERENNGHSSASRRWVGAAFFCVCVCVGGGIEPRLGSTTD